MKRTAIYARYSSDGQRETSIEDQVRLARDEASRRGWSVVAEFTDAARSGSFDEGDRPGFARLMEAVRRREVDVIVVDSIDRLSRNTSDALRILARMKFEGVGLIGRTDGINTVENGFGANLLFGIKSVIAEEFLRDLAAKAHRGVEGAFRRGFSTGGIPYGYRSVPAGENGGARLVTDEADAAIVRRIYSLRLGGDGARPLSLREITDRLNAERVPPPGARWRNRTKRQASS